MFVANFNKGRAYNLKLIHRNALLLGGVSTDRIANTDTETQSVIFGEGFGRLMDPKIGLGDGYLYALSISDEAVYRVLPETTIATFSDIPMMQELEKDNEIPTQLPNEHELEIPFDLENNEEEDDDEGKEENDSGTCKQLAEGIDQINEHESRGVLNEQQANELRERIESLKNNLRCK
jgi:hypothetical protein